MRTNRLFSRLLILLFIAPAIIVSCTKESTTPVYKNFVSKQVSLQLTKEYLSGLIDIASETNPEVLPVKPLILNDVTVYKIVYKTTVKNQETEASGLVCVPAVKGSYPVLSFQNGTNTLKAS